MIKICPWMHVFTDSSINTKTKVGIGCYLILDTLNSEVKVEDIQNIKIDDTSSTIAELTTIQYVLKKLDSCGLDHHEKIYLYTDCENFINLIQKRKHNPNLIRHRNYDMYKKLIDLVNDLNIEIIWVKGHSKKESKTEIYEKIFSLVDKTARSRLRENSVKDMHFGHENEFL